ncbi:MAG: diguanylate cyclase [Bacteriovoracia bacterium]
MEQAKARIIVADDDPENLKTVSETLLKEGFHVKAAGDGEAAFKLAQSWIPHVMLLDINMPKMSGLECLKKVRALKTDEHIIVILVTANSQLEEIIQGLDLGANDYIVKPYRMDELRARLRAGLRVKVMYDNLIRANKRLEEISTIDELTGLKNMKYANRRLEEETRSAIKGYKPLSCIMFDMDHFKKVNDEHDHLFGSHVLTEIGQILRAICRPQDIAARFGGDEFFILLPDTDLNHAEQIAQVIRKKIEAHVFESGLHTKRVTASFGVSGIKNKEKIPKLEAMEIVRSADRALYSAKHAGRNCVEILEYGII